MSEHPLPAHDGPAVVPAHAGRGLVAIFGSTFFELVGYFMLAPYLILRLKGDGLPTALAGVFAATGWAGIFLITPFASAITQRLGRRGTFWLSAAVPVFTTLGFALSSALPLWFLFSLLAGASSGLRWVLAGASSGLRWVLAEAVVAEFSPPARRGRYVGVFETMVGATFVLGPVLLAWLGAQSSTALWVALAFIATGFAWSLLIPPLPTAPDAHTARVGWRGVWFALRAHPVFMAVGFVGGFFESGLTAILPLYGLSLGLGAAAAALLVSASGLGSALMMLPAGVLADRMAQHPRQRWGDGPRVRRRLMQWCAATTLVATLVIPFVAGTPWLAAPLAFVWGSAGGCLYTLVMIDIGSREQGITLVNSTAVLVMSYTLGGVLAPVLGGAALQWAPVIGFPALLLLVAGSGWWLLRRL